MLCLVFLSFFFNVGGVVNVLDLTIIDTLVPHEDSVNSSNVEMGQTGISLDLKHQCAVYLASFDSFRVISDLLVFKCQCSASCPLSPF